MAADIFKAIGDNDKAAVEELTRQNPDLAHARNPGGVSALLQARYEGRHEIVTVLRKAAGELDVFQAATLGDTSRLQHLLAGDPALAQAYSGDGFTALHLACFFSQPQAAEILLRSGADVNAVSRNPMKVTVINSAAASGLAEVVAMALKAGADPNARQMAGYTVLQSAAARDSVEMVQALLDAGADPSLQSDDGKTALDKAGPTVAALLRQKAKASAT
jgi:ankyrin repeat protein